MKCPYGDGAVVRCPVVRCVAEERTRLRKELIAAASADRLTRELDEYKTALVQLYETARDHVRGLELRTPSLPDTDWYAMQLKARYYDASNVANQRIREGDQKL